jgi:hypothetical protein
VQVDSAIILVLFRVEFHSVPPCVVVGTFIIPSGMEQGGLNEYQGVVADMAHLHLCPHVKGCRSIEAFVFRAGRQVRHAAKLWR